MRNWLKNDGVIWGEYKKVINVHHTQESITTGTTIYNPPSDYRFAITDILISVSNDNLVTLKGNGGSDVIISFDFKSQGNKGNVFNHNFSIPYFFENKSDDLKIITTTNAKIDILILGFLVDF
jgi:hypothetical protein